MKVHIFDEGYTYIPKRMDFIEDPNKEISGNQIFQARETSYPCYYVSRGRDCKTQEKFNFFKKGKTVICRYSTGRKSEIF